MRILSTNTHYTRARTHTMRARTHLWNKLNSYSSTINLKSIYSEAVCVCIQDTIRSSFTMSHCWPYNYVQHAPILTGLKSSRSNASRKGTPKFLPTINQHLYACLMVRDALVYEYPRANKRSLRLHEPGILRTVRLDSRLLTAAKVVDAKRRQPLIIYARLSHSLLIWLGFSPDLDISLPYLMVRHWQTRRHSSLSMAPFGTVGFKGCLRETTVLPSIRRGAWIGRIIIIFGQDSLKQCC